jgi:hypothetical protein
MLALLLASARAGTWTIQLPPDQRAAEWEEALELTGLVAATGPDCHARVSCTDDGCQLLIRDGEAWRSAAIPAPRSAADREQIALKARSMLQERAEVHNTWQPDLSDFLDTPPPAPVLPDFPVPAPVLPPLVLPPPTSEAHIPAEVATWPEALRPALIVAERAPLALWGAASVGGERRSTASLGVSGGVSGGVSMLSARLGLGLDLSAHSPTRRDDGRAWSTWGAAGTLWVRPVERLQISGLAGGHRLRFTQDGDSVDAVQRAFAAAELSAPLGPLWLTARLTSDLSPVTLYEIDQWGRESVLADLGVLWSAAIGVRWWLGE